jgi:WD40 repeat protein
MLLTLRSHDNGSSPCKAAPVASIRLWDVADPSKSHLIGSPTPVSSAGILSIAFSGNGKVVASGQGDGTVQLYDISDGLRLRKIGKPLAGSNTAITSLAFDSNGKELVTGIEGNGQVGVWDLSNLAHPLPVDQPLPGSPSSVLAVAFSPDGSILATGNVDHTVRLWNFNITYAIKYICVNTADNLGSRQWNSYFPGVPFKDPCRG